MSFILDALKKSENERQRQGGPALFEVKVAAPKPALPMWAVALAALLVVNISVVIWLVLRKPAQAAAQPAAAPALAAPLPAPPPPAAATAAPATASPMPQPPLTDGTAQPAEPMAAAEDAEPLNPEDYEPAVAPSSASPSGSGPEMGHATRGNVEGLPTYEQVAAGGSVPELHLNMHVFAAKPAERFVFLNMQRLREGDSLPNGVRVEQITPGGVMLSHQGSKFMLERE